MKQIAVVLAAPLLMLAAQANAQMIEPPVGIYVGGAITQTKFDTADFGIDDIDDKDHGWKATLGYRFNRSLGIEGSFVYFGESTASSVAVGGPFLAESRALTAYAVGFVPVGPVDLLGKIGLARIDAQGNVGPLEYDERTNEFAYGVGAQMRLSRFAIRAEYEKFDTDVIGNLDMLSLGVTYTFGSN
jgi:opacity protein-like surface antigen